MIEFTICTKFDKYSCDNFTIYVVPDGSYNLLGRDFLNKFNCKLTINKEILSICNDSNNIPQKYPELFKEGLGCYRYNKFALQLKPDANPVFLKPRPVPISLKPKVEEELARLEKMGVITQIENSDWATPLVPVLKEGGGIRLCGDYKISVNKSLENVKYPLPKAEEIFSKLNNGESFTKIDLSDAYNQIELEEESTRILTWNTHKGLYQLNRLPYGITPASAIFQQTLESTLQGLRGCADFLDDIIVTGVKRQEHEENLQAIFKRLKDAGFKLKLTKCAFFQPEITYLGYTISKVSKICCDNGREYENYNIINWAKQKGIVIDFTIPYTPQFNGKVERLNQTLIEKVQVLLTDSKLEKAMWGEALFRATYLVNRSPTTQLEVTPAHQHKNDSIKNQT